MSNLHQCYSKFLSLLHPLIPEDNLRAQVRKPNLSDKKLIALSLAAEATGVDSELHLFKQLPREVEGLIERSVYNKRRRHLIHHIDQIRQRILCELSLDEDYLFVDSMPLEVCKFSRAKRSKVCRHWPETAPDYGYCAAQKMSYFGYKFHATCTAQGIFKTFDISKASVHDIHYLNDLKPQVSHCVLVGDKGYLSQAWQDDLFETRQIKLETPKRKNQPNFETFSPLLRKTRKRIETLFSQLCDQFMIRRNYAKSFQGFSTRIMTKVTALTLIQWCNKLSGNKLNHLKIAFS